MTKETPQNIAMVGMYGGMWREYNPGCFMIGLKTKQELLRRMAGSTIDVFSIDNKTQGRDIEQETIHGLDLNFFGREQQIQLLNETLSQYNAIVLGGDIIWGGDDVVEDNDIFFVNSPQFLHSNTPTVLFNCVHTFYDDESILAQRKKFENAVKRSVYASVRTIAIQKRLHALGITDVQYVPDPVLDVDMKDFPKEKTFLPVQRDKPILGISLREKLSDELLTVLRDLPLENFDVVVFPFSRQYKNLETLKKVQSTFGNKFRYFDHYLDPIQSYQFVGELDMFLNDTYHGVIASILHGKPFVSLDVEPERTSRKQQLLETIGVDDKYNVRLAYKDPQNIPTMRTALPELINQPLTYSSATMQDVHMQIQAHYDRMAEHILAGAQRK